MIKRDYQESSNTYQAYFGTYAIAQTFTPSENYKPVKIGMKMYRVGSSFSAYAHIRYYIYEVDKYNHPDIIYDLPIAQSAAYDPDDVTTSTTGEWIELNVSANTTLLKDTTYAIVTYETYFDASHYICIRQNSAGGYSGGEAMFYSGSWQHWTGEDYAFRVYSINAQSETVISNFGESSVISYDKESFRYLKPLLGISSKITRSVSRRLSSFIGVITNIIKSKSQNMSLFALTGLASISNVTRSIFKNIISISSLISNIYKKINWVERISSVFGLSSIFNRSIIFVRYLSAYIGNRIIQTYNYDKTNYYELFDTFIGVKALLVSTSEYYRKLISTEGLSSVVYRLFSVFKNIIISISITSVLSRLIQVYRSILSSISFNITQSYNHIINYKEIFITSVEIISSVSRIFFAIVLNSISVGLSNLTNIGYGINIRSNFAELSSFIKNSFGRVNVLITTFGLVPIFSKLARLIIKYSRDRKMAFSKNYNSLNFTEHERELKFKE